MDEVKTKKTSRHLPWLFFISLVVYLGVRLVALEDFPIFFFTDEAIQSVHAADFIRNGFKSPEGEPWPTFFVNGNQYNLSTSVYLQILPVLWFGRQIWVTRGISVLITVLAAISIGLFAIKILNIKAGWLGILLFSIMPAWFYHSRTAFETVLAVSFYACFLLFYALYREKNPNFIFPAVLFAAFCFYSYSPAQVVIALTIILLGFSDLRYHWQQRETLIWALGLGLLCLMPYLRFLINHPDENNEHLRILGSYWMSDNISFTEKIGVYLQNYLSGLNPVYWFLTGDELVRHVMKGYGHLLRPAFPFMVVGFVNVIKNLKISHNRLILISLLAAPSGAAVAEIGITRALFMVIPAAILSTIGLWHAFTWFLKQKILVSFKYKEPVLLGFLFTGLVFSNFYMMQDSLRNGGIWFTEYGMFGLQYGAKQVFHKIEDLLKQYPESQIYLSPDWTNGTDIIARYFFDEPLPFQLSSINPFLEEQKQFPENSLFILTPEEIQKTIQSGKFSVIDPIDIIPYPNGQSGFYITRLAYAENAAFIFEKEEQNRHQMTQNTVRLQNQTQAFVEYSPLDMGEIQHVFDNDLYTVARTWDANPFVIKLDFEQPQKTTEIRLRIGGEGTNITLKLWGETEGNLILLEQFFPDVPDPREVIFTLEKEVNITAMEIAVKNVHNDEIAHVHLWEVKLSSENNQ